MSDRVCVVGAGSSGIVALKTLLEAGIDCVAFEQGSGIGGNWRFGNDNGMSSAYDSLHINTSKERMAYSDYPMPADYPDYPHHSQVLAYFENYTDHFGLREHIVFESSVTAIERVAMNGDGGGWRVTVDGPDGSSSDIYRAVLVANGHHWSPRLPDFPGNFDGQTLHSHDYKTSAGHENKRVLVVGIGNSGVDIACELSRVSKRVFLSTRRSAHILPKYAWGRPIDHYASPRSARLPTAVQQALFTAILKLSRGNQERYGIPLPDHSLLQAHPTISEDLPNLVGHGKLTIKPNLERLDGDGVCFVDDSREEVDTVIFATGYNVNFPFLDASLVDPANNRVSFYRNVVDPEHPGLYFVGLIQPLGAVMPLSEAQSRWIAKILLGDVKLPTVETMRAEIKRDQARMQKRYVTSDRHTIQVDFYPYLHAIEKEMTRRS